MKVALLSYTQYPQKVIFACARQCYSVKSAQKIFKETEEIDSEKLAKFIKHLAQRGHLSPLEHVSFTFAIEGISRTCSHQLVRHRIASYSQQSQRYVEMDNFKYIIPPSIEKNPEAKKIFNDTISLLKEKYRQLKKSMEKENMPKEKINQDLRFILPEATETKIAVTMNTRELLHFFSERLCLRAQWEIRSLASKMFQLCKKILPEVFTNYGAKCKQLGYCPENDLNCPLNKKRRNKG